jgi:hypothetical protein
MPIVGSTIIETAETCGIEFETEKVSPDQIMEFVGDKWFTTHDASIETDMASVGHGIRLARPDRNDPGIFRLIPYQNTVVGTELVSRILHSSLDEFYDEISRVCNVLTMLGEPPEGERAGIHFHFSYPAPSLKNLKSILRLGKYLEAVFYYLGGMGYEYRGLNNDSVYCRPITKFGPVCVEHSRGGYAQVFNIYDLLKTTSQEEFWYLYGDCRNHSRRYNPVRYHWLNLFPMCPVSPEYRGTLEFRVFNKSLNARYVWAVGLFCKKFVEYSIKSSYETLRDDGLLKENSIYNPGISKDDVMGVLDHFGELSEIEGEVMEILMKIIERTPTITMEGKYIHTHLRQNQNPYWSGNSYDPRRISSNEIHTPHFIDIHVLRGE